MATVSTTGISTATTATTLNEASIKKLTECYQGELSAVETYEKALNTINDPQIRSSLQQLLASHSQRVAQCRERLTRAGCKVPESSGLWGIFAKTVQSGADLISTEAALAALEEGEDHGIKAYATDNKDCDADVQSFVIGVLLPEQRRTHDMCRNLKAAASKPS